MSLESEISRIAKALESIAEQLPAAAVAPGQTVLPIDDGSTTTAAAASCASSAKPESETPATPVKKKTAAKKKRASKKAKSVEWPDLAGMKDAMAKIADASGVETPLPEMKRFIKSAGYATVSEIDPDKRGEFMIEFKAHFDELREL